MRNVLHASRVVLALAVALGVAVSAWAQTTGTGAFDKLSRGDQKIARALFEAQKTNGATAPLTLDEIAARKQHTGDQYWAYADGGWYVSSGYNGPWIVVEPQFVPRPVLLVPVRYYHMPPGHWGQWENRQPPRWHEEYGHEWADKREWRGHGSERQDEQGEDRGHRHGRDW